MADDGSVLPLSVVICTYNRPDLVRQVLGTIAEQDAPRDAYEVLVVDNASPRDIAGVVAEFEGRIPGLRCIREDRVGLSHARNRGCEEAQGEYVGYVDDDCRLPPEWVSVALRIAREVHPVMFGGPYRAFYMTPKPKWFRDEYGSECVAATPRFLRDDEYVTGMNMVINREGLASLGGFRGDLGMVGSALAYGEETELQMRLRSRMSADAIWYDPALHVYHLVRPEKMRIGWLIRHRISNGRYYARLQPGRLGEDPHVLRIAGAVARALLGLVWGPIRGAAARDRHLYPYYVNYFYERNSHNLFDIGYALELLHRPAGKRQ
jgi:glycosyltransferase involved in cell wall biosynthesis